MTDLSLNETTYSSTKPMLAKIWDFVWNGESVWSWIADIILAFVIIKFIFYPLLGLLLGTGYPIVAVVSGSMEHDGTFEQWWSSQSQFYESKNITKEDFLNFPKENGFNKGDMMILYSKKNIQAGDIAVFMSDSRADPIIHRVVMITEKDGKKIYTTKGDHNSGIASFEQEIPEEKVIGKGIIRIPLLGWIKIGFVNLMSLIAGR